MVGCFCSPPFDMSEAEIIEGCIKQDRRAQNTLYNSYYPLVHNIISRYATDEDDKSTLINAGFFKVLKKIEKYNTEFALATWIRNVVVHNCIDEFRKKKNSIEELHLEDQNDFPVQVDYNSGLKELEQKELLLILNTLPKMAKTVFNLFAIDGYSHKEIGVMLGITSSTSRWHMNFARNRLKNLLSQKSSEEKKMIELAK
jgi:RNA polymerase sigma factor (sigma-70 family)